VVTEAEIVIDDDVILDGEGKLSVDGQAHHRVLVVRQGATAELRGLTVTGGAAWEFPEGEGGGIFNQGTLRLADSIVSGNYAHHGGGGIYNGGTLTLANSTVSQNFSEYAGGIDTYGTLTLINTTVSGNGAEWQSGGIYNSGTLTLINTTVSGNSAYQGGGIYCWSGNLTLINTTVSGNSAYQGGGILSECSATLTNCLVDGDCSGDITSGGHNIESPGDTCGFDADKGDLFDVSADDLKLGPLQDNGGPTETHAPLSDFLEHSVAIDVIPEGDCVDADGAPLTTDQRGLPRPVAILGPEPKCDVGSVEVQASN
jgi:predicted outer membrane repeat protein